jgi:hypothetical protein
MCESGSGRVRGSHSAPKNVVSTSSLGARDSRAALLAIMLQAFSAHPSKSALAWTFAFENEVSKVQNLCTWGVRLRRLLNRPIRKSSAVNFRVLRSVQPLTLTTSAMLRKHDPRNCQSEKADCRELYELLGPNLGRHADRASVVLDAVYSEMMWSS